jgi:ABC-type bacteriocin/lantibiotic exporter with double-glycine peptidase domain
VLLAGFSAPMHELFSRTRALQGLAGDLTRIEDVLRHPADEALANDDRDAPPIAFAGGLEFRDVTFGYDRGAPPLVENLSFVLRPGGRVALVGASGCGKSTVARLAAGLYHPWSGEILFDGRPRETYERSQLARALAYVDQDIVLFEGTVRENLTLWDAADNDTLHAALGDAALEDIVAAREGGLDAPLQEGARNLSGGQRQRLEIARALAARPAILVLDAGGIVERGTHAELLAMGGRYARLVASESHA